MYEKFYKAIKATSYEAGKGAITIGAASINIIDIELPTLLYLFVASVIFDILKEVLKPKEQ